MNTKSFNEDTQTLLEEISGKKLTFANLIWSIRKCEELTQVDFAAKLGISKQQLCDIEHGRKAVSPILAAKYASLLGYSKEQFIRLAIQDMLNKANLNVKVNILPSQSFSNSLSTC
jgi:DNA-binding XRE family transcriptional regulator